jgi:hypothetical protein
MIIAHVYTQDDETQATAIVIFIMHSRLHFDIAAFVLTKILITIHFFQLDITVVKCSIYLNVYPCTSVFSCTVNESSKQLIITCDNPSDQCIFQPKIY